MKSVKQYRTIIVILMGLGFVVAVAGLLILVGTRGAESAGMVLTKIGIVSMLVGYTVTLFVAFSRWRSVARGTKTILLVAIALSVPIIYGLLILVFS